MKKQTIFLLMVLITILILINGVSAENYTNVELNINNEYDDIIIPEISLKDINDKTTEYALEGIVNAANDYITFGKDNILTLSAVR